MGRGVGRRDVVAFLVHDHRGVRPQPVGQALQVVQAVVVILVKHADLRAGVVLQHISGVDARFALVRRLPAERPLVGVVVLVEGRCARGDEELRDLFAVQVVANRGLGLGAQTAEHRKDLVLLHELLGQGHRLRRVVSIVEDLEVDLAAVDATLAVDVVEVGELRVPDRAVCGGGAGLGDRVAETDRVGGDSDVGLRRWGAGAATARHEQERRDGYKRRHLSSHRDSS